MSVMQRLVAATAFCFAILAAHGAPAPAAEPDEEAEQIPTYMRGKQGWFWYEDRAQKKDEHPSRPAETKSKEQLQREQDLRDLQAFKNFQRELEEAQQIATINPSDQNMLRFLRLLAETRRKASVFTDVGSRVASLSPSVDDTLNGRNMRPTTPAATKMWDEQRRYQSDARIKELAKTHGMFFFFRSDCPHCHAMAPVVKRFAARFGMTIFPVSMDGPSIPEFPQAAANNGIAARILEQAGIPPEEFAVPFVVMARPTTKEMIPIGFGAMTDSQLVERIDLFAREAARADSVRAKQGAGQWRASEETMEALRRANDAATKVKVPGFQSAP